ncbi:MAG: flavodoxin family protein [Actinomycetota bacterium]|jgi:multimeric flavodoxin WrbA|nr:flavodoxin family protein [Actinomycetota bacterium]
MNNKKIKILTIYGSPRKNGNTDELMKSFERGINENNYLTDSGLMIESLFIRKMNFSPCIECRHCSIDGECLIKDDMQQAYLKLIEADLIAVSSPVFFVSVSALLKSFIDRCQRFWSLKYELKKRIIKKDRVGIFISAAGADNIAIFDCSKKVIKEFFNVLYVKYEKNFLYNKIDNKGDILKKPETLKEVFEYGKNVKI